MINLMIIVMASVGLTIIITDSFILEPVRNYISEKSEKFGYLVNCPMCMGVWAGACVAIFYELDPFKIAMITSLVSFVLMSLLNTLSYLSDFLFTKIEEVNSSDG